MAADLRVAPAGSPRLLPSMGPVTTGFQLYRPAVPAPLEVPQMGVIVQPIFPQVTTHTLWPASAYQATGRTVWCPSVGVYAHCF
jgi:hypothetical protein